MLKFHGVTDVGVFIQEAIVEVVQEGGGDLQRGCHLNLLSQRRLYLVRSSPCLLAQALSR
jgi:hypothetical protein